MLFFALLACFALIGLAFEAWVNKANPIANKIALNSVSVESESHFGVSSLFWTILVVLGLAVALALVVLIKGESTSDMPFYIFLGGFVAAHVIRGFRE